MANIIFCFCRCVYSTVEEESWEREDDMMALEVEPPKSPGIICVCVYPPSDR